MFRLADQARKSGGYQEKRLRCILCFADEDHPPRTEHSVAKELGVSRSAVRAWRSCFEKRGLQSLLAMHRATDATHSFEFVVNLGLQLSALPPELFLRRKSLADLSMELDVIHGLKVSPQFLAMRRRRGKQAIPAPQLHEDARQILDMLRTATPKEKRAQFFRDLVQNFDTMREERNLVAPEGPIKCAVGRCAKIYGVSRMTIYRWLRNDALIEKWAKSVPRELSKRPPAAGPHTRTLTGAYRAVYLGWLSSNDTHNSTFSMPYAICFRANGCAELVAPRLFPDERVFSMGKFLEELRDRGLKGPAVFACMHAILPERKGRKRTKEARDEKDEWLKLHLMKTEEKKRNDERPRRLLDSQSTVAPGMTFFSRFEHIEKTFKEAFPEANLVYTDDYRKEAAKIWATRPPAIAEKTSSIKPDTRIDMSGKFQSLTQRLQYAECRDELKNLITLVRENPQKYKPLPMVWHAIPESLQDVIVSWVRESNARTPHEIRARAAWIRNKLAALRDSVGDPKGLGGRLAGFGVFFGERHGVDSEIRQEVRRYFKNCIRKLNAKEKAACEQNPLKKHRLPRGFAARIFLDNYANRIGLMWIEKEVRIMRMSEKSPMGRVAYFEALRTLRDAERMLNSKNGRRLFTDPVSGA